MSPEENNNQTPEQPSVAPEQAPVEPSPILPPTNTPPNIDNPISFAEPPASPMATPDATFVPPTDTTPMPSFQPVVPPVMASPPTPKDKNSLYVIIGIVAAVVIVAIIAVVLVLFLNGNKKSAQNKGDSPTNSSISSIKDVKTLDDAVAYAKNVSKYKNAVISDLQFMDNGTTKTYKVSVIDIDGYKKDTDSEFYYYPEKKVEFDTKGTQNVDDGKMSVYSPEYKKYYGYGGKRSIDEALSKAKSELTLLGGELGKTYLFELNDSTFDDSDSWELMWAKSGQDEKSGELKATAVELKDSDFSVVRSGDASLYIW